VPNLRDTIVLRKARKARSSAKVKMPIALTQHHLERCLKYLVRHLVKHLTDDRPPLDPHLAPQLEPIPLDRNDRLNGLLNWAIALGTTAIVVSLQWMQLPQVSRQAIDPARAVEQERLELQVLGNLPTLGYDNLLANWVFLRFLGYFGDDPARKATGYDLNANYFNLITQRDPRFLQIYPYLSAGISYYLGNPELAGQYMERGLKVLSPEVNPKGFIVLRFRALDQLLLEGDIPGTIATYGRLADWFDRTADPKAAQSFRNAAAILAQNPDSVLPRFWGWQDVYFSAPDDRVRQRAEQELIELGAIARKTPQGEILFVLPDEKQRLERRSKK
jgi:hypothetical protein